MSIKQRLKKYPDIYLILMRILNRLNYFNIRFNYFFPSYTQSDTWKKRTALVLQSPDNERIPRAEHAGELFNDHQRMHNGLKITLGSYYDYGNTILLQKNKGVHEPQEEYIFQEILKRIPEGSTMIELGSYWAFYSMWFASFIKDARCFMIEPDPHKINFGQLNFKLNKLKGTFLSGFISDAYKKASVPQYSVDYLMKHFKLDNLAILHSDIQGYEVNMLKGATDVLKNRKVDYIFISTHSNALHLECISILKANDYSIVCDADLDGSYSSDGLIVASSPNISAPPLSIHIRRP